MVKKKKIGLELATISYFGDSFRHDMSEGFPLLTTKKDANQNNDYRTKMVSKR